MSVTNLRKSLLLIGPQRSRVTAKALSELRSTIINTPRLAFLQAAINELPSVWPTIIEAYPALEKVHGDKTLQTLQQIFKGGELENLDMFPEGMGSMLFDVITVLYHVVDLWELVTGEVQSSILPNTSTKCDRTLGDVQGFCIGFLTAAAVSGSKNLAELEKHIAVALRLAVCAGALVELDSLKLGASQNRAVSFSVSWNSEADHQEFTGILSLWPDAYVSCLTDTNRVTVTVPTSEASSLEQKLSAIGMSVQPISLQGRYHFESAHGDGVRALKALCEGNPSFQLPNSAELQLPLRSNVDGGLISTGTLHDIALESILLRQCQWYQTVQAAITSSAIAADDILPVGPEATIPRSVAKSPLSKSKPNGVTNGIGHELKNGSGAEDGVNALDNAATLQDTSAVAVVGMACRYPNADTLEEFWKMICAGESAVRTIPEDRFKLSETAREPKGTFWGNFLRNPDVFDNRFFGISGREAKYMDPQQRLVLQVAYEALESAGYFGLKSSPDKSSLDVGCYLGVGSVDYGDNIASHDASAFSALGSLRAFISGRVSHYFGWSGPSITYDTACSSGAVAIHAAVNAIRAQECSMALAGGVNVITSPALFQNLAAASFLSPTGASKAFDAGANGYCRGEGAGLVLLKPLARALADGDSVLAVITGSAVNQGANCSPITVPVSESQSALYRKALDISGIDPKEVSFVEAHGTGTPVGDPIECESIRRTFGGPDRTSQLYIGSVKDNIGHTEAASGAAALIKTIMMMQKRVVPKQANFTRLNPKITSLEEDRVAVSQNTQPWDVATRIAVVNNYGAAGSNAAIVLREPASEENNVPAQGTTAPHLVEAEIPFFISAKTAESLQEYCRVLKGSLASIEDAQRARATWTLAYNLAVKQNRDFDYNYAFTASNLAEVATKLDQATTTTLNKLPSTKRSVVLCIGGQNGQTVHLDETMLRSSKLLEKHLNDCDRTCHSLGLPSLFPAIFKGEPVDDLVSLHCMLFSLQYASAKSWLDSGLQVDTIVGHSFGQLTALAVAGALSLSDGLRVISERARLIQSSWGNEAGAMLSVQGEKGKLQHLMDTTKSKYPEFTADIACYNGPSSVVLAGDRASLNAVEQVADLEGLSDSLKLTRLPNTHAFHSSLMDGILPGLREVAATLTFKRPAIHIEACSQDQDWNDLITADMLVQHSRDPVYFDLAVKRIADRLGSCVFVEAGSASPIVPMARRALMDMKNEGEHTFIPVDIGPPNALSKFAGATCNLWSAGVKAQYWPFHHSQKAPSTWINLPPYQFENTAHWMPYIERNVTIPEPTPVVVKAEPLQLLDLLERTQQSIKFRVNCMHEMFELCTTGHAVLGQSLCPASMYVEIAVRAANVLAFGKGSSIAPRVRDLKISSPLSIKTDQTVLLQLVPITTEQDTWEFTVMSPGPLAGGHLTRHATGTVSLIQSDRYFQASRMQFLERIIGQNKYEHLLNTPGSNALNGKIVYQVFGQVVDYAPYYRGVKEIVSQNNQAVGVVALPSNQIAVMNEANCDPITLDNFLQVAGIHVNCLTERNEDEVFICTELGELFLSDKFLAKRREIQTWNVYSSFEKSSGKTLVNDIFVFDPQTGDLLVVFLGAIFQAVPLKSLARTLAKLNSSASPADPESHPRTVLPKPIDSGLQSGYPVAKEERKMPMNGEPVGRTPVNAGIQNAGEEIRQLLSRVIEIPIEDVQPSSSLVDLGVDSLMSTDVLNEIKSRFNVTISASEFLEIPDVQSLARRLGPVTSMSQVQLPSSHPQQASAPAAVTAVSVAQKNIPSAFSQVQQFLGDILGVPMSEIAATTPLGDLGVDSLMATEVLTELKKQFGVTIPLDEFQDIEDVGSLAGRLNLQPSASSAPAITSQQSNGQDPSDRFDDVGSKRPFVSLTHESFVQVRREFDDISKLTNLTGFYESVYPAQMDLVVTYVAEAFQSFGCALANLAPGDKILDIQVLKKHQKVKSQIYRILEDARIIQQDSTGQFVRTSTALPQGQSEQLHQAIISQYPQHAYEHDLLASTGSKLADCLTGRTDPLSILFGSAQARTLMENVYTHAPMFKTGTINLAHYLVDIFNNFKERRPIRILELGAGTGGTTKHLIEELTATKQELEYTFTDLSPSLVAAARRKFAKYPFMKYTVFNIEEEPAPQFLAQYDIVISTNCIHATKDLTRSCTNINKVLRPSGILCLVELTRNLFWFDLVFGLLEGWWLFEDGRQHALANENLWRKHLSRSGFHWMDWTVGDSEESNLLRVITASPSDLAQVETVEFKRVGDVALQADIYYPPNTSQAVLPVALMIHGGGHVMLSRKDIRPAQTQTLLDAGFLPVSIDYRLCPEMTLADGPMRDVCDALSWCRTVLPTLTLQRPDIRVDGSRVVAVGWSTGGHLALTLGFTAPQAGVQAPNAILAFYCPSDYEDPFWKQPNLPFGQGAQLSNGSSLQYNLLEGVYDHPITAYNPPAAKRAMGGWMNPTDPRSRIALHMNWKGRALHVLLNGLSPQKSNGISTDDYTDGLPEPSLEQIQSVSPLAHIQRGAYQVPTFIIHGTNDDLIPWQQAKRTYDELRKHDVVAEIRILEGAVHLFDLYRSYEVDENAKRVIKEGYEFLSRQAAA
ncbi:hypothetical protein P175DRAFT_0558619 [Aspergillus ochraceoroseus IBT 24754]|uniref:S-adenosyl-L-methionine-dependent N-methyltransferase n=2 Tax=Aspergillus ochraceoroseus TaxID=138278 RepID=A0A2T5LVZ2_9EURO|nr:uncharacterized protein P175DRAFT_0558619 [Aspergillus ochraceoroseus IBT 24754]KKK24813.1 hypothetical protein AOCH_000262 [Aspergillus ochraceoroseus]PTU20439.1 hypothetical protein P175DRAFT_0558619 [Aspergillus ochraceoroseus IBT 24754]